MCCMSTEQNTLNVEDPFELASTSTQQGAH